MLLTTKVNIYMYWLWLADTQVCSSTHSELLLEGDTLVCENIQFLSHLQFLDMKHYKPQNTELRYAMCNTQHT